MISFLQRGAGEGVFGSKCDILVNPVNCVGVMGAGLALEFKKRYPKMFEQYAVDCRNAHYNPGRVRIVPPGNTVGEKPWICNFATKDHWKDESKIEWIESGLKELRFMLRGMSVALPMIGTGLGGIPFKEVESLIIDVLQDCKEDIEVYV